MNTLAIMSKYKNYKFSNVDWLDDIPVSWSEKKLKFLSNIDNSGEFGVDPELKALNYPVATTAQITSDGVFLVEKMPLRGFSPEEVSRYLCKAGDILVVKSSGSISNVISGKVGIVSENTEPFIFSNFLLRIRSNQNKVVARYIYYLLTSNLTKERVKRMVTGSTYPNLQVPEYVSALMPSPPFNEQTRIVNFLNDKTTQIDQAIAIKEKQIALLKERKQILIQNAVTRGLDPNVPMKDSGVAWIGEMPAHWEAVKLKFLFSERNERTKTGAEVLFSLRMEQGLVPHDDVSDKFISDENLVDYKIVYPGQMVMNRMRAAIGIFGLVSVHGLVSPDYAVFDMADNANSDFFLRLFKMPLLGAQFRLNSKGLGTGSSGFMRLYTENFGDIKVALPPIEEQTAVVTYIETESAKIDKAIALQQQQISKLKEYKTTLINAAVTGKIKVPELVSAPIEDDEAKDIIT